LLPRGILHVEELAVAGEFPPLAAHVAVFVELHVGPFARLAGFAVKLRREAVAVDLPLSRQRHAGERGEGREQVGEIGEVLAHGTRRCGAGPICDERHAAAAFVQLALPAVYGPAIHRASRPAAVVAGEDDERILAQMQLIEFGGELADLLVDVGDVVGIEPFSFATRFVPARGRAVGRALDRRVDQRRRIINEERLVLVASDEIENEFLQHIWSVFAFGIGERLAVEIVL